MNEVIYLSEATAALRRVKIRLTKSSDNFSPATSADITAAVAQISPNGGALVTSTNPIVEVHITNFPGLWYLELTQAELTALGVGNHYVRFKEADCLESTGGDFQISPTQIFVAAPTLADILAGVAAGSVGSVSGAVGSVNSLPVGVITASSVATDAVDEIGDATADKVWDEARSGHVVVGSFGEGGTALSLATDAISAASVSTAAAVKIADATLGRDFSLVAGAASRSLLNAARWLRNRLTVNTTTNTVTATLEDDSTPVYTKVYVGTDPTITDVDPT